MNPRVPDPKRRSSTRTHGKSITIIVFCLWNLTLRLLILSADPSPYSNKKAAKDLAAFLFRTRFNFPLALVFQIAKQLRLSKARLSELMPDKA